MSANYLEDLAAQILSRVPREDLPDENARLLFRLYAVLAIAKGSSVTRRDVHAAWVAWMTGVDPHHRALVAFEDLEFEDQEMDEPYVVAIREVALDNGF